MSVLDISTAGKIQLKRGIHLLTKGKDINFAAQNWHLFFSSVIDLSSDYTVFTGINKRSSYFIFASCWWFMASHIHFDKSHEVLPWNEVFVIKFLSLMVETIPMQTIFYKMRFLKCSTNSVSSIIFLSHLFPYYSLACFILNLILPSRTFNNGGVFFLISGQGF